VTAAVALLCLPARPASAQESVEAAPAQASSPPYAPPPAPPGYYPPPPPTGVYRPFSLTIAAGPGRLMGPGEKDWAVSYNLFRVGLGVARNLSVILGFEGSGASSVNPKTHADSWLKQEVWYGGVQYHLLPRLHVRASVGIGAVSETTAKQKFSGGKGTALSAAIGYEFIQMPRTAVGLELVGNTTRYQTESWEMVGLNLALSFF
jgi:hypothetical protein